MTNGVWIIILVLGVSYESAWSIAVQQKPVKSSDRFSGVGMSSYRISFVDLVFRCQSIAEGRVSEIRRSQQGNEPESFGFAVTRSFRQTLPAHLQVIFPEKENHGVVDIDQSGMYLLFFQAVIGDRATLYGNARLAVWPHLKADWLFSEGHVQPLDVLVQIIEELLKVDSSDSYDDRARMLTDSIFLGNPLGEIAALQYANSQLRWPEERLRGTTDLRTVKRLLAAEILVANRPLDIYASFALADLMRELPLSVAFPKWITGLSDSDVALRDASFAPLKTEAERWTNDDFGYDSRASEQERRQSIARWQRWFEGIKVTLLKEEVADLLRQLESQVVFERESADLALQLISDQNQKFSAEDNKVNRDAAVKRWEEWWKRKQQELKKN